MSEDRNTYGCDQKTIEDCRRDSDVFVAAFHQAIADAGILWITQHFKIELTTDGESFPKMYIAAELIATCRKEC